MKHSFKKLRFIILAILLSNGIMYSQTVFWEPASPILPYTGLPTDSRNVWSLAVANNGDIWAGPREGIYLSTDNGDTWVQKNKGIPMFDAKIGASTYKLLESPIGVLAVNPVTGSIFAGDWNGNVYRSTNNGDTWIPVIGVILNLQVPGSLIIPSGPKTTLFSPSGVIEAGDFLVCEVASIVFTPSGEIYVAIGGGGIYYSSDNGDTWINKSGGLPKDLRRAITWLALGPDGTLYVSEYFNRDHGGLFRSTDGGDSWVKISDERTRLADNLVFSADGSMYMATGDAMYYIAPLINGILLKSTDKGVTWNKVNIKISGNTYYGSVDKVIYNPITKHLLIVDGRTNEINISTDLGSSWYKANSGFPIGQKYSNRTIAFTISPKTGMIFVGLRYAEKYNVYRSTQTMIEPLDIIGDGSTLLLENYPNPFNPSTVIRYQLRQASPVTLKVFDIMGREVATLVNGFQEQGIYNVNFNALQYGIASGIYFYKLNADGVQIINKMLLMK